MYLLEQYLHAITRIFETDGVSASEFLGAFLAKFLRLISDEQTYFVAQFGSSEDFNSKWVVFRRENEYDMIQKRIRPWILGTSDITEVCECIDTLNRFTKANPQGGILDLQASDHLTVNLAIKHIDEFAAKRLFQDMQERLLVMSNYKIQQILDLAPQLNQNSITNLLLK